MITRVFQRAMLALTLMALSSTAFAQVSDDLSITKSLQGGGTDVVAGTEVIFDFLVTNEATNAELLPMTDVLMTDTLPAGMTFVSASGPDLNCGPAGNEVFCQVTQGNEIIPSAIYAWSMTVAVASDVTGPLTNTIEADYPFDLNPDDNTATLDVNAVAVADLRLEPFGAGVGPNPAVAGAGVQSYGFLLTNDGPSDAPGVSVDFGDTLPAGVTFNGTDPSTGTFDPNTLDWTVGTLAAGEFAVIRIDYDVAANAAVCTDCIDVTGGALMNPNSDPDSGNNLLSQKGSIDREFDLELTVVESIDPVLAGSGVGNLTHTFSLSRVAGPSLAEGVTVEITPNLPAGVSLVSGVPTIGGFAGTTWTVGDVDADGAVGDLVLTLTVDATATDCTDCVSASGTASATSGTDTVPANNTDIEELTSIETAAGGGSTTFPVTIDFSNDFDGSVMVSLTCNTGNPLSQEFEITEAGGVDFVVQVLDFIAPTTTCEVSLTDIDGAYISNAMLANGVDTGSSCVFSGTPVADESAAFDPDRSNTCEIAAVPTPNVWTVSKVWLDGGSDISQEATFDWECTNASQTTDGSAAGFGGSFTETGEFDDVEVTVYPAPGMTATCSATEDIDLLDDSVESDQGCESGNEFTIGSGDDGCTITNSVFFEGIPSLNQYGLAIMALLMLGVGMVGFRRFV